MPGNFPILSYLDTVSTVSHWNHYGNVAVLSGSRILPQGQGFPIGARFAWVGPPQEVTNKFPACSISPGTQSEFQYLTIERQAQESSQQTGPSHCPRWQPLNGMHTGSLHFHSQSTSMNQNI